ncbi:iron(III) ABC transporter ATP-binding protein [Cypionkella aquatica]|uniref:Iron(III) ABC transporter ATP-binding protein n=1 Tax=Cypionkella aquatica TaxID=1756042 RepID=A0AA37TUU0_9RHOB|nr:ABC transporter ATP-binding protein [Cypionkella aquatica]GLS85958.1 iron(III) ABC transporter ATP-binding protein [Cypionkella aquatica]
MFRLSTITKDHGTRRVLGLDSLTLGAEGLTVILGHNGSGKSTLLGLLARTDTATTGQITLNDQPLAAIPQRKLAQAVAYLPQRLPPVPGLTLRELVRLGRYPWRGALGRWQPQDHAAVNAAMQATGAESRAEALVETMSGGERQRGYIAMLLAQDAPILLLDEPTSALDPGHAHEVLRLLRKLVDDTGRRVIVVLHDVNLATRFADRVVALREGRIAFDGPPAALLRAEILSMLYAVPMQVVAGPQGHLPLAVVS